MEGMRIHYATYVQDKSATCRINPPLYKREEEQV